MHNELSTNVALVAQIMCSCSDLVATIPNANYISALFGSFCQQRNYLQFYDIMPMTQKVVNITCGCELTSEVRWDCLCTYCRELKIYLKNGFASLCSVWLRQQTRTSYLLAPPPHTQRQFYGCTLHRQFGNTKKNIACSQNVVKYPIQELLTCLH